MSNKKFPYTIRESWSGEKKGSVTAKFRYPADARVFAAYMNREHTPGTESFTVWYRGDMLIKIGRP